MTEDREAHREERDNDLIKRLAYRAEDLRSYFRKWIELEAKELDIDFSLLIPQCNEPAIRSGLEVKQRRVTQIAYTELAEHLEHLEKKAYDLKNGATDDLVEDMWQLEDGINYLRGLVRELRDIRAFVDSILDRDRAEPG